MLQILLANGGSPNQSVRPLPRPCSLYLQGPLHIPPSFLVSSLTSSSLSLWYLLQDGSARVAALLIQTMWRQWLRLKMWVFIQPPAAAPSGSIVVFPKLTMVCMCVCGCGCGGIHGAGKAPGHLQSLPGSAASECPKPPY
jgi:hypothetical protein